MKIENIPDSIDPTLNLDKINQECLDLVKKRAYFSAGAAIIPIPFLDVVIDVGILSQLIPEISARFGLSPEHITVYDPKAKKIHWNELRKRGFEFSGLVVARTAVKKSLNGVVSKVLTKQVTKFIPLGGQIVAASLGYIVMKKVAEAHVEECYKLAKGIQKKTIEAESVIEQSDDQQTNHLKTDSQQKALDHSNKNEKASFSQNNQQADDVDVKNSEAKPSSSQKNEQENTAPSKTTHQHNTTDVESKTSNSAEKKAESKVTDHVKTTETKK